MPGFGASQLDKYQIFELSAGFQETNVSVAPGVVVGAIQLDPSIIPPTINGFTATFQFNAILMATAGMTASLELYNATDAVSVQTLTSAGAVPNLQTVALTVPADLPNSSKLYLVRLLISAGVPGPADRAYVYRSSITVSLA